MKCVCVCVWGGEREKDNDTRTARQSPKVRSTPPAGYLTSPASRTSVLWLSFSATSGVGRVCLTLRFGEAGVQ